MITLLRKIRKSLIESGSTRKYFLYAIGEILLVMIGILLALQINNWNEERKERNVETAYLQSLKEEFEYNLREVDRVTSLNASANKNALSLAQHTGPEVPVISEKEFAVLLFGFLNNDIQYRPGSGVINEIISSGKLNIFRDQELKKSLSTIDGLMLRVRYQEKEELENVRMNLISLLQNGDFSSRRMIFDAYGGGFGMDEGKFDQSNLHLLNSIQFDNYLTQYIYTAGFLGQRYEELKEAIKNIIQNIDLQIST